ncbi:hypothetical protein M422DRAFT_269242 [Sphaerobolus stellatus SS14]|uniref:Uncharacterized protein n=1 Tax=Sphaerobolus stellatus (strain SS14) TaxID=990650 RepID=A0A0C9UKR8_SPHS4|nr:hypothetical protein M422DRAFT_269242 [Sphaerobolus stellatus SS14]
MTLGRFTLLEKLSVPVTPGLLWTEKKNEFHRKWGKNVEWTIPVPSSDGTGKLPQDDEDNLFMRHLDIVTKLADAGLPH